MKLDDMATLRDSTVRQWNSPHEPSSNMLNYRNDDVDRCCICEHEIKDDACGNCNGRREEMFKGIELIMSTMPTLDGEEREQPVRGVTYNTRRGRWVARYHKNGINHHVGYYHDQKEAIGARKTYVETALKNGIPIGYSPRKVGRPPGRR